MFKNLKGFTLIELLVVIAIIGILSTVVIGSVNSARTKGKESAAITSIQGVRVDAEIFYDAAQTYASMCSNAGIMKLVNSATRAVAGGTTPADGTAISNTAIAAAGGTTGSAICTSSANAYVVALQLSPTTAYCVDNTGTAKKGSLTIATSATACP